MVNQCYGWILILNFLGSALGADAGTTTQGTPPTEFRSRVESWFRTDAGKPLKRAAKEPPLRPGSGNYTRAYSYSIVDFAARCFHLGEQLDEANAALVENARHYLDHPLDIIDRDSFHWHADIVMRLIDMYGRTAVTLLLAMGISQARADVEREVELDAVGIAVVLVTLVAEPASMWDAEHVW